MDIIKASIEDLEKELERKKRIQSEYDKPKPIKAGSIDMKPLISLCVEYINFVDSENYYDNNDWGNYIEECAIETVFGDGVWDWINAKI